MTASETIFALSTAPGRAGVAVLRVSGPMAGEAARALSGEDLPAAREARLRGFRNEAGELIDKGLLLWFPGPNSFTGEDLAEFHVHGGRAVIQGMIDALSHQTGLRPAEAGEFTRRAFDAGKLDLTEVEGLADLINAETDAQRRQAVRQMGGSLSRRIEDWRARVLHVSAHMEAAIDFSDEELPEDLAASVRENVAALVKELDTALAESWRGERLREGLSVAIVGAPNAGKSSLLNAIAGRDAAIVSETAGTTRDVVEVHLDLAGYPVILADTAGLRELPEGGDGIEAEGIRRARARAAEADITLAIFDAAAPASPDAATRDLLTPSSVVVWNKTDLAGTNSAPAIDGYEAIAASALTGQGLDSLLSRLESIAVDQFGLGEAAPAITRARHRTALEEMRLCLARALDAPAPELAAEDLRLAARTLGRITGRVDVEDLLDVIFHDFCIGK
ncbi:tRNA uridine-5-carboxymethylaminomethyl(34) synthesis GTPase MnmE [Ferruginivarius sediminum]|uniref:tRNA modification GTPase MnmE n=1 Tax=Ferruginivarius sediminum TaxID=2661937 RepID=A0A369TD71_9PROT|nr:tRNA uridine-5-carboxymethylaminomethyl(34) synthesis GTPase MnmE [Ferruginivarius sediminum]RDD63259.1 tRNA uridine-5-carboxymethylaminomethyl(34) synthesis GTPase MnmE [Ferruginivarius sediminum]